MHNKGISVVVCCFNSALRLPETIRHLALQQIEKNIPWELIVVNNASTDDTKEVAFVEWQKHNKSQRFIIVDELEPGLIHARRKGFEMARFEYIVFCDDDNWLREDYLQIAFNIMEKNPTIGALGGQGEVVTNAILPEWWENEKGSYAVGKQAKSSSCVNDRGILWGAGLVLQANLLKSILDTNHPFLLTGRRKEEIISGEDAEICSRVLLLHHDLYYSNELRFKHMISSERLTKEYRKKLIEGFDAITGVEEKYKLSVKYVNKSFLEKVFCGFFRIGAVIFSGFNKRKIFLMNTYLYFIGIRLIHDYELKIITSFIKKSRS